MCLLCHPGPSASFAAQVNTTAAVAYVAFYVTLPPAVEDGAPTQQYVAANVTHPTVDDLLMLGDLYSAVVNFTDVLGDVPFKNAIVTVGSTR